MMLVTEPVLIVGAGLAGLSCATELGRAGRACVILEASDGPGGRVRTDLVDGFRLDRGFQVLLSAYPETSRLMAPLGLDLRPFDAGARVWTGDRFRPVYDPLRHPSMAVASAASPLFTVADKCRLARLWMSVVTSNPQSLLSTGPDRSTAEELSAIGLSAGAVDSFLRPFFGGVFLQDRLTTSSRFFRYVLRMFSTGRAVVPAGGMGRIPEAIADALRRQGVQIRLATPVASVEPNRVRLASGETIGASAVVVATELPAAKKLVDLSDDLPGRSRSAVTVYFAADRPVLDRPVLVLNGVGPADGPVNHSADMTAVSPDYAPPGRGLIAASVLDTPVGDLVESVRVQLRRWFGETVDRWRHLATYRIDHALPPAERLPSPHRPVRTDSGIFVCGDHRDHPSIEGAVVSGQRAARAIAQM